MDTKNGHQPVNHNVQMTSKCSLLELKAFKIHIYILLGVVAKIKTLVTSELPCGFQVIFITNENHAFVSG